MSPLDRDYSASEAPVRPGPIVTIMWRCCVITITVPAIIIITSLTAPSLPLPPHCLPQIRHYDKYQWKCKSYFLPAPQIPWDFPQRLLDGGMLTTLFLPSVLSRLEPAACMPKSVLGFLYLTNAARPRILTILNLTSVSASSLGQEGPWRRRHFEKNYVKLH